MMLSALGLGAVIAASDTLFHVITWLAADGAVMLGYAKCGAAISKRLAFNRITGGAFVAAGGALAVANR